MVLVDILNLQIRVATNSVCPNSLKRSVAMTLLMLLDLPCLCDFNIQSAQPQWGMFIVSKLWGHTGILLCCLYDFLLYFNVNK